PTWGSLLVLLGVGADFHLSRVIAVVQIFLLMLAGVALGAAWREIAKRWNAIAAAILTLILLYPLATDRLTWLAIHFAQSEQNFTAYQAEHADLERAISLAM